MGPLEGSPGVCPVEGMPCKWVRSRRSCREGTLVGTGSLVVLCRRSAVGVPGVVPWRVSHGKGPLVLVLCRDLLRWSPVGVIWRGSLEEVLWIMFPGGCPIEDVPKRVYPGGRP
jgi:hypothetical protein